MNDLITVYNEEWRLIEKYPYYEISNYGRVRSSYKRSKWSKTIERKKESKILKLGKNYGGYTQCKGFIDGKAFTFDIHRILCEVFHGSPPENKPYACHKDDNKRNNTLWNIEWKSSKENSKDKKDNGRGNEGEKHGASKLTNTQALEIINSKEMGIDLARKYNISTSVISNLRNRNIWKHLEKI